VGEFHQPLQCNDGILRLLGGQPCGLLAIVKLANFFLCRLFRLTIGAKGQHPAFASRSEADAVEGKAFSRAVDFRPLILEFDFNRKFHFAAR
jgi:hypothetical protein